MVPPAAHNLVAAGRCIDGDAAALSSVRVMGPCSAMGAAAAHALDLAGSGGAGLGRGRAVLVGSVHDIDVGRLRERLGANLGSPVVGLQAATDDRLRWAERLMFLTDDEKRMRDGAEGDAVAAAMDLLIRYGFALDAERLCDIRNVAGHHDPAFSGQGAAGRRGRLGQTHLCALSGRQRACEGRALRVDGVVGGDLHQRGARRAHQCGRPRRARRC